jgi:carotenoid cleavage dioxygenase
MIIPKIALQIIFKNSTSGESEGYVMAIVHDLDKNQSKLVVIDAHNFDDEPVAQIILPQRVPFGAHGSWLPN